MWGFVSEGESCEEQKENSCPLQFTSRMLVLTQFNERLTLRPRQSAEQVPAEARCWPASSDPGQKDVSERKQVSWSCGLPPRPPSLPRWLLCLSLALFTAHLCTRRWVFGTLGKKRLQYQTFFFWDRVYVSLVGLKLTEISLPLIPGVELHQAYLRYLCQHPCYYGVKWGVFKWTLSDHL